MKLNAKILGIKQLTRKFDSFKQEGLVKVAGITRAVAGDIEAEAKILAPKDTGKLAQGIKTEPIDELTYRILATEVYSAFMEFGTGGLVDIPKGWEALASQFKGEGKKQINLSPQPFMYPAFKKGEKLYHRDLKRALLLLNKKYNKK
tara:strand:+ start:1274 stop:1714 length:441 start_codon:yes stop_codon:yes gene_type:complete